MTIATVLILGGLALVVLVFGAAMSSPTGRGHGALAVLLVGVGAAMLGVLLLALKGALWLLGMG